MSTPQQKQWDTPYEWRAVLLMGLGFGLVGLDRWIIAPLFPVMMTDLHLTYQDLGNLAGILAISWGVFAGLMGHLSDRYGRRRVLIPALIGFSVLSGLTGVVSSLYALLIIRFVMGASEGAYLAASVAATADASHPKRRGLNQGLQQSAFSLMGFGLAPIIATQLLEIVPSWRYVFVIVSVPGLIVAYFVWRIIRDPLRAAAPVNEAGQVRPIQPTPWGQLLRSRNIIVAMIGILCCMSCIFVLAAMFPSYLINYLHLSNATMGVVMSALGIGGFLGAFIMPGLSDYVGRKPACLVTLVMSTIGTYLLIHTGAVPVQLYMLLFMVAFFCSGLLVLLTGPVATEGAPAGLTSSAAGIVSGTGEIFGGGIGPAIAGYVAQHRGIEHVLDIALIGLLIGIVTILFLRETAPRKVGNGAVIAG